MKRTLLLLTSLLTLSVMAQENEPEMEFNSTTLEEYNYMTKGYRIQLESGLDMKKGYEFTAGQSVDVGGFNFDIRFLGRSKNEELAGVLTIIKSSHTGNEYYIATPVGSNTEVNNMYFERIDGFGLQLAKAYSKITSILYVSMINKLGNQINELEKK